MILLPNDNVFNIDIYTECRIEEVEELLELGCFGVVPISETKGHGLYRSRFVDPMKAARTEISRLCASACSDEEQGLF